MSLFPSILVPLDGSETAARALGCAIWLAARLHARLHIVSVVAEELPADEALTRLQVPREHWDLVTMHQARARAEEAIVETVMRHGVRLLVITARGETGDAATARDPLQMVGHVTQAVIENSPVPVLLLPPSYEEKLPWKSALVPVSGEAAADEALALAVRLAGALAIRVHVAHVTDSGGGDTGIAAMARYSDELHHEYPLLLEEFVSRAVPRCTPEECRCIEDVSLCYGDVTAEVLKLIERKRVSLLAVGWHGQFMTGHAAVLKKLIEVISCPVLLVKPAARMPFRLMVGEDFE